MKRERKIYDPAFKTNPFNQTMSELISQNSHENQESQLSKATGKAETGTTTLFKGVNSTSPGYEIGLEGIVKPRRGSATALEHNTLTTEINLLFGQQILMLQ